MNHAKHDCPRAARVSVNQNAVLITRDGTELSVVLTNVSAQGLRIRANEMLYNGEIMLLGELVIIRIARRDDLNVKIIWTSGCEAGGVFLNGPELPEGA